MTERKLLNLLRDLKKNKQIPEDVYNDVRPSEGSSKPARFYGRLKLHKESKPLQPVVSTCGMATYDLAKWLSKILRPLVGSSGRILKDTKDLVEIMDEVALSEEEILMSFDVKSLFTSIPVDEAISVCEERLKGDDTVEKRTKMKVGTIVKLLQFCLKSTEFAHGGVHSQAT